MSQRIIQRPLPVWKRRALHAAGFATLALCFLGLIAFAAGEAELKALLGGLPFGPRDYGLAVIPMLGTPLLFYLILVGRLTKRYGSCELVPGALLLRPLWGPEEKGMLFAIAWVEVARVEEREECVRLELRNETFRYVPTTDPTEVELLLQLHREAEGKLAGEPEDPDAVPITKGPRAWIGFAWGLWVLLFGLAFIGCVLKGIGRFAPGLGRGDPELLELLLLLVLPPLFTWFCRVQIPRLTGSEFEVGARQVRFVEGGLIVNGLWIPYASLSFASLDPFLALAWEEERRLIWVGDALGPILSRSRAHSSCPPESSEAPAWAQRREVRGYALATAALGGFVALSWWVFVA